MIRRGGVFKNSQGFSTAEALVSGGILAIILLAVTSYSRFAVRMNVSNQRSSDFATLMASVNEMVKSPSCDVFIAGLPFDDSAGQVGRSQGFSGFNSVNGLTLASPSPAPGFALTNTASGEAPSFQIILVRPGIDSIAGTQLVQDTVTFRISLKKADSSGKPLLGSNLESKDITLNVWVDQSPIPHQIAARACTLKNPRVLVTPLVYPTCVEPGAKVTVTWDQEPGNTPILRENWSTDLPQVSPSSTSAILAVPSPFPNSNLVVSLTERNEDGDFSPAASSLPFASYNSPTVSASFVPNTFSNLPTQFLPLRYTMTGMGPGSSVVLTSPANISLSGPGGTNSLPQITSAHPGQVFSYTLKVTNPCGESATATTSIRYAPSPNATASP